MLVSIAVPTLAARFNSCAGVTPHLHNEAAGFTPCNGDLKQRNLGQVSTNTEHTGNTASVSERLPHSHVGLAKYQVVSRPLSPQTNAPLPRLVA